MKKIKKKWIGLWVGCIVAITLSLMISPSILLEPDRSGIFTKGSIHLVYSQGIEMSGFRLVVNPVLNTIFVDFSPNVNGRTTWGLVGVVLPYVGTLGDGTGWRAETIGESTIILKEYRCTEKIPCSNSPNREEFVFNLADKIDSKSSSVHRVLFKFLYSAPGKEYDYLLGLEQNNEQYELGFAKLENPKVMISLDRTAMNVRTEPPAERPSSFSDKYLERIWSIENEITYTTEYEIPSEKELEESYSSIPTYLALVIAVVGTIPLLSHISRKNDSSLANHKNELVREYKNAQNQNSLPRLARKEFFARYFRYGREFLEHLYTGHREIYDVLKNQGISDDKKYQQRLHLDKVLEEKIKQVADDLGFSLQSDSVKPYFCYDRVIDHIIKNGGTDKWEDFIIPKKPNPKALYLCSTLDITYVDNSNREQAEKLADKLNQLVKDDGVLEQLKNFHICEQLEEKYDEEFRVKINDLIKSIDLGTHELGGICNKCISLYPKRKSSQLSKSLPPRLPIDD